VRITPAAMIEPNGMSRPVVPVKNG
jgi:hypothetical protein